TSSTAAQTTLTHEDGVLSYMAAAGQTNKVTVLQQRHANAPLLKQSCGLVHPPCWDWERCALRAGPLRSPA
ncbi:hypothetical protein ACWC5C_31980, partial [Streptomyces sp. NPDC001700]